MVLASLGVAVVLMAGGYMWLRSWLGSESFRELLSEKAGEWLKARLDDSNGHAAPVIDWSASKRGIADKRGAQRKNTAQSAHWLADFLGVKPQTKDLAELTGLRVQLTNPPDKRIL